MYVGQVVGEVYYTYMHERWWESYVHGEGLYVGEVSMEKYVCEGWVKYTRMCRKYIIHSLGKNWPTNHLEYSWQFMSIII